MQTFRLEVITPSGLIFDGEVKSITVPGEEGEFGVLAQHVALTTMLKAGVIDIEKADKSSESIVINWGSIQITQKEVVILVDGAVAIRGESEGDIAKALDDAKELIASVSDSNVMIASASARIESAAHKLM